MTAIMQSRADERIHAAYKINVCALSVEKEEESFTLLQPAVSRHQACVCVGAARSFPVISHINMTIKASIKQNVKEL
jgi:endonuclease IV